jgi:hypothetical protein
MKTELYFQIAFTFSALISIILNVIWFYLYKKSIEKQNSIYKEYIDHLKKHEDYLKDSEKELLNKFYITM